MRTLMRILIFSVVFVGSALSQGLPQPKVVKAAAPTCSRFPLKTHPLWISSAAWLDRQNEIAVVDPLQNKVLFFTPRGGARDLDWSSLVKSYKDFLPATFESTRQGYVLKMVDSRVFWFYKDLRLARTSDLVKDSTGSSGKIGSIYDWIAAGDSLVAYGSILPQKTGRHRFGFFRAPLASPANFVFLYEYPIGDYYLIGNKYIANLGDDSFFVLMSGEPAIYQAPSGERGTVRKLVTFPDGYRNAPPLPQATGANSDEALFKAIEGFKIPAGLYGQDDLLYLLTREPGEGGGTTWYLHAINPREDSLVGKPVRLPTTSPYLTIVPTKETWYVFERGEVKGLGSQDISTMLSIPSAAIRSGTVPKTCQMRITR